MGQEIADTHFKHRDFQVFDSQLRGETQTLRQWFEASRFSQHALVAGCEVEAWLVGRDGYPAAINEAYLNALNSPLVVPELAKFNVELNVNPRTLRGSGLRDLHDELNKVWQQSQAQAADFDTTLTMIGILPTVREEDLTTANMSPMKRYKALNEQVLRSRLGRPLNLDIVGREHLRSTHHDVMLESAATSFQIHLQVPIAQAKRYYNAAVIAAAPMVAVSANSPYIFGKDLWDESRIPLFEQAVDVGGYEGASQGPIKRVTFGACYIRESIFECFQENLAHYPALLPIRLHDNLDRLPHLRLHNGTIWRWNRPLLGFDDNGTPHIRVEHRVMAAGPTIFDQIANAAVYYGLVRWLVEQEIAPETDIPFAAAKDNFYEAARMGLRAQILWLNNQRASVQNIMLDHVLAAAYDGLTMLEVDPSLSDRYLGTIERRVATGQTGSAWQRGFVAKYGSDMGGMTKAYLERQSSNHPVHEWDI